MGGGSRKWEEAENERKLPVETENGCGGLVELENGYGRILVVAECNCLPSQNSLLV